jgi:hypothetical protein
MCSFVRPVEEDQHRVRRSARLWRLAVRKESEHLPANVSIPGVDACLNVDCGGVMRASRGDPRGCGVLMALCMALAPFAIWAKPGEGTCWSAAWGWGDEVICWLRPEGVRDGNWRGMCFLGDGTMDGDGSAGGGCGVGVPAGESLGESSELMSMVTMQCRLFLSTKRGAR